jgi:hypothetical protein
VSNELPTPSRWFSVSLLWPAFFLLGIGAFLLGAFPKKPASDRCVECGYPMVHAHANLQPTDHKPCPECGSVRDKGTSKRWSRILLWSIPIFVFFASIITPARVHLAGTVNLQLARAEVVVSWIGHVTGKLTNTPSVLSIQRVPVYDSRSVLLRWRPVHIATNPWPKMSLVHNIAIPLWPVFLAGVCGVSWAVGSACATSRKHARSQHQ